MQFWANVTLPEGARVLYLDLYYDDQSTGSALTATLLLTQYGDRRWDLAQVSSVGSGGPSYVFAPVDLTIDQSDYRRYRIEVGTPSPSSALAFRGVDLWWRRQVSTPPGSPTFGDVPETQPAYPYVEALYDARITCGCSENPPNFCPTAAVTRGKMAAFLAKALGLHHAP